MKKLNELFKKYPILDFILNVLILIVPIFITAFVFMVYIAMHNIFYH